MNNTSPPKKRVLVFVVAYNHELFIEQVISRIPHELGSTYHVEILIIDDASQDETFEYALQAKKRGTAPFKLHVLTNPINQGYGGNQKIGFSFAIENRFDFIALVHGDGQYAPECLPELLRPVHENEADAVFGSRMLVKGSALKGGMPLYKYVGNKILTKLQNLVQRTSLSEFHSGYRIYSVEALERIPFHLNTNDFHFDTQIIIQLLLAGQRIKEISIPTYYGEEICHVNGLKYAWNVISEMLTARAQEWSVFYDRKYDCSAEPRTTSHYLPKFGYRSPHSLVLDMVKPNSRVLDLGCAGGYMGQKLKERGCHVVGVDLSPPGQGVELDDFLVHDLNDGFPSVDLSRFDYVLLLDVLEHLHSPEDFVSRFRNTPGASNTELIVSTGNVAFVVTRLGLLFGSFNYGKRGILDLTHTRLFTLGTLRNLFRQSNFDIVATEGIPAPFPSIFGPGVLSEVLMTVNESLIGLVRSLFAYQILLVVKSRPTLRELLRDSHKEAELRAVKS